MNWRDIFNSFHPQDEDKKRKMESYRNEMAKRKFYLLIGCIVLLLLYFIILEFIFPS